MFLEDEREFQLESLAHTWSYFLFLYNFFHFVSVSSQQLSESHWHSVLFPVDQLLSSAKSSTPIIPKPMVLYQFHPPPLLTAYLISFHLLLGVPNGYIPTGFIIKNIYGFLVSPILATCLFHLSLVDLTVLRNEVTDINYDVPSYVITSIAHLFVSDWNIYQSTE